MFCEKCMFWVNETKKIGEWEHSEAVYQQKGFCLCQDLFTYKEPEDECDCGDFYEY